MTHLNTCSTSSLLSTDPLSCCELDVLSPAFTFLVDALDFFDRFDRSLEAVLISWRLLSNSSASVDCTWPLDAVDHLGSFRDVWTVDDRVMDLLDAGQI